MTSSPESEHLDNRHRNTLRQRIQRIEELIGQSPEHFEDAVIAGLAARLINRARKQPRR